MCQTCGKGMLGDNDFCCPPGAKTTTSAKPITGTRREVVGVSNTFLCEAREGSLVVARWLEFNTKDGGVVRLAV